ncbi:hypothetical protein [Flavisolibacter tropicus]|nr:hypothetical protein [Flavisolibacter tropicus]
MKAISTLLAGCILTLTTSAQSISTGVSFNKSTQPAIMLLLPYSESITEGAILQKLRDNGYDPETKGKAFWKQNKVNGFYTFKSVVLKDIYESPLDLYFKVEPRGKKENETATVYFLVSKGDEKFITPEADQEIHSNAKKFLNKLVDESAAYKLKVEIEDQDGVVKEAEKKLTKTQESEQELQKKIVQLQEEIRLNKLQQDNQKKVVETEKAKLAELKGKVKK